MTPVSAPPMDDTNDTEITLGTGKMLALFFALVILCAVFFGMGYSMGRNSVRSAPELLPSPSPSGGRPSANQQVSIPAAAPQSQPAGQPTQAPADNSSSANTSSATQAAGSADQPNASEPAQAGAGYFVQVAAVSKQEDAEALVEALKARQYSAIIANQPSDKLFHVQVGPFGDIKDAESTRARLVSDGYNPILKK